MRDIVSGLVDKVTAMETKTLVMAGIGVVTVVVLMVAVLTLTGGSSPDDDPLSRQMVFPDGQGGGGDDRLLEEGELPASVIEQRVAATIAAMAPTATPVPTATPDIPATFQAQMEERRARSERVLQLHPLDRDVVRNPYLNDAELSYMSDLGGVLWANTKAWMHVRRLLFVDVGDWTFEVVNFHVAEAELSLAESEDQRSRRDYEIGDVVAAYGRVIEDGVDGVSEAVKALDDARDILQGSDSGLSADLPFEEREMLRQLSRKAEKAIGGFDDAMSQYGCSVCGELFRLRGR